MGPVTARALLQGARDLPDLAALARNRADALNLGADTRQHLASQSEPAAVERALRWLERPNHQLITCEDARFPPDLATLSNAPVALFCAGDVDLLRRPQLAIVGSRNPTPAGARHARLFARDLAARGLCITSGLALGVDAAAHQGALDADGMTIAVTGTGPDTIYPRRNSALAARIAEHGLLITEYPPGTGAQKENFPRRNRIIAGLALGTFVVEAAQRSGSLITARLAADAGREVFALPGSVDNPMARGCHQLIREGAKLVETAADILEELSIMVDNPHPETEAQRPVDAVHDEDYQLLLTHLDNAPRSIDALAQATGLSVSALSSMLLILELQGAVAIAPGGGYQRSQP